MPSFRGIAPCLWFDDQAEEAAQLYVDIFPDSRVNAVTRYSSVGQEIHGKPAGSVMTVEFELGGQSFTGLNGGPMFQFNEAMSLQVLCETQEEIDYFWERLTDGGSEQPCGWLKDRFGVSWQVVPTGWFRMLEDADSPGAQRAMAAMFEMSKLDIGKLEAAFRGD